MHAMLPSPATERTKSKNIPLDLQLTSCEAQRDLVFARVREPLNQRNHRRGSQNRHFETPQAARTRVLVHRSRRSRPSWPLGGRRASFLSPHQTTKGADQQ